jgi:hypothetical protein
MNRTSRWLFFIIATSALLRLGVAIALGDHVESLPGIFDQISYHTLATRILGGYGFTFDKLWWPLTRAGEPTAHWSYIYTLYLVAVYGLTGIHPLLARSIQAVLVGVLTPWLVYRITRKIFENPNRSGNWSSNEIDLALLASAWVGLYPYFLYYAGALMTESFFIIGILWTIDCAIRLIQSQSNHPKLITWIEMGLAIGVTVLLRQIYLLFVPFFLIWFLWAMSRKMSLGQAFGKVSLGGVISLAVVGVMIAPFTFLNYQHFGRFVLLNTNSGYAFFWANHPIQGVHFIPLFTPDMPSYQDLIPEEFRQLDEAALDQALMRRGIEFVIADPIRFLELSFSRIFSHFTFWPLPGSSLPSNLTRVFSLGVALPFMLIGGGLWFIDVRKQHIDPIFGELLILFIIIYTGIHLASWSGSRYRLPTDAIGLVFGARGLYPIVVRILPKSLVEKLLVPA